MLLIQNIIIELKWHMAKYGDPYTEFVICI